MSRRGKRIERILERPMRMRFRDVEAILLDFGYRPRKATSPHSIFGKPG
jgi:hypothetical protein